MNIGIYGNLGHSAMTIHQGQSLEDISFVGYCPATPEENLSTLEKGFAQYGLSPQRTETIEELLQLPLDILVVDNLFGQHADITIHALEQGLHVFCEKPLATTLEDLERVRRTQEKSQKELWGMYTLRYEPGLYTMRQWIKQGEIGDIRMITCQKSYRFGTRPAFYKDSDLYGGTLPWVAIHGIDAIQYLYPEKTHTIYAMQSRKENRNHGNMEMTTTSNFLMENEVLALVHTDFYRPENAPTHGDDRVRVAGTRGVIEYQGGKVHLISPNNDGVRPLELLTPPFLFQDFIRCIRTGEQTQLNTETSLEITRLALLARESATTKKLVNR